MDAGRTAGVVQVIRCNLASDPRAAGIELRLVPPNASMVVHVEEVHLFLRPRHTHVWMLVKQVVKQRGARLHGSDAKEGWAGHWRSSRPCRPADLGHSRARDKCRNVTMDIVEARSVARTTSEPHPRPHIVRSRGVSKERRDAERLLRGAKECVVVVEYGVSYRMNPRRDRYRGHL